MIYAWTLTNLECIIQCCFVVRLSCPDTGLNTKFEIFHRQALQDEVLVPLGATTLCLLASAFYWLADSRARLFVGFFGSIFVASGRMLRRRARITGCRFALSRKTSSSFGRALAQAANKSYELELGVVKLMLGRHTCLFILEVGKCAVALRDEEQGFEACRFLANIVDEAH